MVEARKYRASLVVVAAAASAVTALRLLHLFGQLRKLRPIKWWSG